MPLHAHRRDSSAESSARFRALHKRPGGNVWVSAALYERVRAFAEARGMTPQAALDALMGPPETWQGLADRLIARRAERARELEERARAVAAERRRGYYRAGKIGTVVWVTPEAYYAVVRAAADHDRPLRNVLERDVLGDPATWQATADRIKARAAARVLKQS
jgi:hypothetical protein